MTMPADRRPNADFASAPRYGSTAERSMSAGLRDAVAAGSRRPERPFPAVAGGASFLSAQTLQARNGRSMLRGGRGVVAARARSRAGRAVSRCGGLRVRL